MAEERRGEEKKTSSSNTRADKPRRATDDSDFDRFWDAYPRKVDKGHARKAWKTAVEKVTPDDLIAAATRFGQTVRNTEPRFIAHPSTWLNGERWTDQPATPLRIVGSATGGAFWDN